MSHNNSNNGNPNNNHIINSPDLTASSSVYYQSSPPPPPPSTSLVSSSSSFGYRLRKRTPSALGLSTMFSRRRASMDQAVGTPLDHQIHPEESVSYSTMKSTSTYHRAPPSPSSSVAIHNTTTSSTTTASSSSTTTLHHRLSKLHLSSSGTTNTTPTSTSKSPIDPMSASAATPMTSSVGRLLFGKEVTALFDTKTSSSANNTSDDGAQNNQNVIQDDRLSTQTNDNPTTDEDSGPTFDVTQKHPDQDQQPFHMFLITATLTTLRTKLLTDCDRTLANSLHHPPPPFPIDDLKDIMQDLRRMSDMVGYQKQSNDVLMLLDKKINDQAPVKEITSLMKQVIHDDVSQHYKVHEKSMVIPCKGYKMEGKNSFGDTTTATKKQHSSSMNLALSLDDNKPNYAASLVEHMDQQAHWFRTYYIQQSYSVFCGYDEKEEPILITSTYDPVLELYRVITRVKQLPDRRDTIQDSFLLNAPPPTSHHSSTPMNTTSLSSSSSSSTSAAAPAESTTSFLQQEEHHPLETTATKTLDVTTETTVDILDTTWKAVLESSSAMPLIDVPFNRLKKITQDTMQSSGLEDDVLKLDENGIHTRYKFGILYVKEGQTKEEEWFSNEHESADLDCFLNVIGRRVPLVGYTGWAAGLDTKTGDSGEYTYVTTWQEHSIAYHVSTLLPSSQGDKQQIQRKRHIGNDIVCLVFVEGKQPFNPAAIKSQFLHVFIVVHKEGSEDLTRWRVEIASVETVPSFGPPLPDGGVFFNDSELQSFLLAKLINAEYAALKSPKFAQPLSRAREGILSNIVERGYKLAQDPDIRTTHSFSRHSKSPSTSSECSLKSNHHHHEISPTPSRSSMIKDLSEGITGLGRRRSTQDSAENRHKAKQARRKAKGISEAKQNRSESELLAPVVTSQADLRTSKSSESVSHHLQQPQQPQQQQQQQGSTKSNAKKDGFKQRAQTIFTSFSSKRQHQQQQQQQQLQQEQDTSTDQASVEPALLV
ncbi:unnamed protein product [Absidia cylindrospora]